MKARALPLWFHKVLKHTDFPANFLFGAATAAYQIEGHSFGGAGRTHWDSFADAGHVVGHENGAIACDHYHRYREDLDLMKGFDAYRFSTSWARVLPEGKGQINQTGLDFYDQLVDAVLERNLKPFLTLYHWDLPETLARLGGWTNRDIAGWFADFTDIVMDRIGDRVESVATINEPWCVSYLSHFLGHHAPGLRDIEATANAVHNVLLAHGTALQRLRERGQKNLGIVLNFEAVCSHSSDPVDELATGIYDAIMNRLFIEPIMQGTYPDQAMAGLRPHFPENWQDDMDLISQPLDWLGVNYYTAKSIAADVGAPWPHTKMMPTTAPKTQMGWDNNPKGLHHVLTRLTREHTGNLPIFITENGMAWDDYIFSGKVNDKERLVFIAEHLEQIHRAIVEGVNIQGYFYWSLLDNYEWAYGYEKRFGLIHVDYKTMKRTPKKSYYQLQKSVARGLSE